MVVLERGWSLGGATKTRVLYPLYTCPFLLDTHHTVAPLDQYTPCYTPPLAATPFYTLVPIELAIPSTG